MTPSAIPAGLDRYEIPCRVHGEILVGDETIELDGRRPAGPLVGRPRLVGDGLVLDGVPPRRRQHWHGVVIKPDQATSIGYRQRPNEPTELVGSFRADEVLGPEGMPIVGPAAADGTEVDADPQRPGRRSC